MTVLGYDGQEGKMSFHIGQRVICVREKAHQAWPDCDYPRFHEIYTIRELTWSPRHQMMHCLLAEIVNPERDAPPDGFGEPRFAMWRFRPLIETKSKISFTEGAPKDSERWDNRNPSKVLT